jgi:hypothetical protein
MNNVVRTPIFLVILFLLTGCRRESMQASRTAVDAAGTNQLVLFERVKPWLLGNGESHDFHSLVWRIKSGTNWIDRAVVSKAAFQFGTTRERWVNDIQSVEGSNGIAIIKVAEESAPISTGSNTTIFCVYSWREWNLVSNREIRTLRVCKDPFEKY